MSAGDESSQAALDDAGIAFSDAFVTTGATADQSLIANDISKSLFDPSNVWDFQGTTSLESFNLATPTSTSQAEFLPQTWAFQGFDNLPAASSTSSQSAAVSASIDPINLFAQSSDPNGFAAPSED